MTKKEAKARKAAWQLALAEGRVVNWNDGFSLTSYATVEQAQQALATIIANGLSAHIVQI
jgi:hypothetical protein